MDELERLILQREEYVRSLYMSLVYIIAGLLIPSALAAYAGNYSKEYFGTSSILTFFFVVVALTVSWFFIYKIYNRIDKKMVALDHEIKEKKKSLVSDQN